MKTSTKIVLAILVAALAWYYFKGSKKPCCAGCAAGDDCSGAPSGDDDAATGEVQTATEKGFFYDTVKSKWVKKQPARFIDDDLSSF